MPGGRLHARRHASACRTAVPSKPAHPDLCAHASVHTDPPLVELFSCNFCVEPSRPVPGYGAALSANPSAVQLRVLRLGMGTLIGDVWWIRGMEGGESV